ncbi:hypothetical protein ABZ342_22885, partial [Amycolatopsis sp. NPDC005961]
GPAEVRVTTVEVREEDAFDAAAVHAWLLSRESSAFAVSGVPQLRDGPSGSGGMLPGWSSQRSSSSTSR